jgi:hypothetical protein
MLIEDCWNATPEMRPSFSGIVRRLDNIIVDIAILDPLGNQFWKKNFLTHDQVRWTEFVDEFAKLLKLTSFLSATHPKSIATAPVSDLLENNPQVFAGTDIELNIKCLKVLLGTHSLIQYFHVSLQFVSSSLMVKPNAHCTHYS